MIVMVATGSSPKATLILARVAEAEVVRMGCGTYQGLFMGAYAGDDKG